MRVATVRGQARQAEARVGQTYPVPIPAAYPQAGLEHGARTVRVPLLAQHPAQVDRQVVAMHSDRLLGLCRLFQMSRAAEKSPARSA